MLLYLISIGAGLAAWSFGEYALHNWWGHVPKGKNDFSREHLAHHTTPTYFAPTAKKVRMALVALAIVAPISILVAGGYGAVFAGSFIVTYVCYEVIHRRCHTHAPRGPYSRWVRKHHFHHHFTTPKLNHGVTSPVWDIVFRTHDRTEVVRVPARHAMVWLTDDTGQVKPEYAADYVIASAKRHRAASPAPRAEPPVEPAAA